MNENIDPDAPKSVVAVSTGVSLSPADVRTKKRNGRNLWIAGAAAAIVVIAATIGAWWLLVAEEPIRYTTVPVSRGAITRTVTATGTVNPELTIIVGTYVSGVIQELYCDYNTEVTTGQICAKIDPRPYQSVVDQNKANLAVAKAQLEKDKAGLAYAKRLYERNLRLSQSSAVSRDALDNSQSLYEQAQAQIAFDQATIDQRQAMLDTAQVNLDYTDIKSPVKGTVVSRNVTMGQTVAASFQTPTLFLIASDLTRMQVDTNVSESDIGGIKVGNKATFVVDAFPRRTFEGAVEEIRQSPQTVQNVVTFDVVVTAKNPDLALKPGMTAATRIILDQHIDVIRVPNQALRYTPGGARPSPISDSGETQIWVIRDGSAVPVQVTLGLDDETFTEITEGGLKVDDQVIVGEQRSSSGGKGALPRPRF